MELASITSANEQAKDLNLVNTVAKTNDKSTFLTMNKIKWYK